MPAPTEGSTARQALDILRETVRDGIVHAAAQANEPYAYTKVTDESQARQYVPGSLFSFKDGSYGYTALAGSVRKAASSPTVTISITKFGEQKPTQLDFGLLKATVDRVVYGCLVSGADKSAGGWKAGMRG